MYELIVHDDAVQDVRALATSDVVNIRRLLVFLQELSKAEDLLDRLLDEGYEDEHINIDAVSCMRAYNLWRLKVRALDVFIGHPQDHEDSSRWLPYRILYAPDHRHRRFYVLAVLRRDGGTYDPHSPRFRRLLEAHGRLGLGRYGQGH